jgi:hypothetical protein
MNRLARLPLMVTLALAAALGGVACADADRVDASRADATPLAESLRVEDRFEGDRPVLAAVGEGGNVRATYAFELDGARTVDALTLRQGGRSGEFRFSRDLGRGSVELVARGDFGEGRWTTEGDEPPDDVRTTLESWMLFFANAKTDPGHAAHLGAALSTGKGDADRADACAWICGTVGAASCSFFNGIGSFLCSMMGLATCDYYCTTTPGQFACATYSANSQTWEACCQPNYGCQKRCVAGYCQW